MGKKKLIWCKQHFPYIIYETFSQPDFTTKSTGEKLQNFSLNNLNLFLFLRFSFSMKLSKSLFSAIKLYFTCYKWNIFATKFGFTCYKTWFSLLQKYFVYYKIWFSLLQVIFSASELPELVWTMLLLFI